MAVRKCRCVSKSDALVFEIANRSDIFFRAVDKSLVIGVYGEQCGAPESVRFLDGLGVDRVKCIFGCHSFSLYL
jgi:hypothetical protein